MKTLKNKLFAYLAAVLVTAGFASSAAPRDIGIFEGNSDIGAVLKPGSASYNAKTHEYEVAGAGYNVWFDHDEFHYLWKKKTGDFILYTRASLIGKGVDVHRKVGWMVRSSLDGKSAHINAVVHGDGLTSLQYRRKTGANTEELKAKMTHADVIQLERKGNTYTMRVAKFGAPFETVLVSELDLGSDVYVGLFTGSHNKDVLERGTFSDVRISTPAPADLVPYRQYLGSNLEILDVTTGNRQVIYSAPPSIQAPNWTPNGKTLIYNEGGQIYTYNIAKGKSINAEYGCR